MRGSAAAGLLALGAFTLVGSFGFYLNDEMELGAAAYNLQQGRVTVDAVPPEYYSYPRVEVMPRILTYEGHGYIAESRATAVLGAAAYPAVVAGDALGSAQLTFTLVAAAGLFGGAVVALGPRLATLSDRRRGLALGAIAGLAAAFVAANAWQARRLPLDPWGPAVAVQLGVLLVTAVGVGFFHRFATLRAGPATAHLATAVLVLGTGLAVWSHGQKYHAPIVSLLAGVLYLRFARPPTAGRWAAAYALAGVAVWFHLKAGGLLLLALLAADAVAFLRKSSRPARPARTAAVLGVALLAGLAPFALENWMLYGTPISTGYVAVSDMRAIVDATEPSASGAEPTSGGGDEPQDRSALIARRMMDTVWTLLVGAPVVRAQGLRDVVLLPPGDGSPGYSLLMIAPLLLLALPGLVLVLRRREASILDVFLVAYALLVLLVYAPPFADHGAEEPRYYTALYPVLAWYAALYMRARLGAALPLFAAAALFVTPLAVGFAVWHLSGLPRTMVTYVDFLQGLGLGVLLVVAAGLIASLVEAAAPRAKPWAERARATAWSLGFVPSVWFVIHACVLYPRFAWAGIDGGALAMMVPVMDDLRAWLHTFLTLYPKLMGDPAYRTIMGI